ncbi:SEFIR domain protein [Pseudodesulfovibrio mercurii]|jgi:hypothetical protein|uniref:SEFIR domain protein n=1 Tax=Pseudodesulfovibrio mercurii TaxID=641491 RepID=F0JI99_9BACT|nr:toll/interleukin-1 receptor domain-containing protein [Pseudodesulfovibrio mercurii]EGB15410.1 SEFIR domain protein [Pseudodesulfovibrio mercurii]
MSNIENSVPKVFISYSWTTPDYESQVVALAERLVEMGVDVVLDKWDLVEGADVNKYMEQMRADANISKVLMLCDKAYAEKADSRKGGVGTETLIITPEIYGQTDPASKDQRYIPIIMERDEQGHACCPIFLSGRSYIDMSTPDLFEKGFEQLLRAIFNKPVFKKPELGKPPAYILSDEEITLGSTSKQRAAMTALQSGKANALGACRDYFDTVIENLERFRVEPEGDGELDDRLVRSIEMLEEPKNELVEFFATLIRYVPAQQAGETLRRFIERLYPFTQWPDDGRHQWVEIAADNYRFFLHELFLCAVAIALKEERFEVVPELVQDFYFVGRLSSNEHPMKSYTRYRPYLGGLNDVRNARLELNRRSIHADMLKSRADMCPSLSFYHLMQADFFLYLHSYLHGREEGHLWYPISLLYIGYRSAPFEVFARSQSTAYFERMKVALGVESKVPLVELCGEFATGKIEPPKWGFESFSPAYLITIDALCTKP